MLMLDDDDAVPAGTDLVAGEIYSTDMGDPADVEFASYTDYGLLAHARLRTSRSGSSCFDLESAHARLPYVVAIPLNEQVPPVVVGVMPARASATTVRIGQTTMLAPVRAVAWFLARSSRRALEP